MVVTDAVRYLHQAPGVFLVQAATPVSPTSSLSTTRAKTPRPQAISRDPQSTSGTMWTALTSLPVHVINSLERTSRQVCPSYAAYMPEDRLERKDRIDVVLKSVTLAVALLALAVSVYAAFLNRDSSLAAQSAAEANLKLAQQTAPAPVLSTEQLVNSSDPTIYLVFNNVGGTPTDIYTFWATMDVFEPKQGRCVKYEITNQDIFDGESYEETPTVPAGQSLVVYLNKSKSRSTEYPCDNIPTDQITVSLRFWFGSGCEIRHEAKPLKAGDVQSPDLRCSAVST